ncbi:hypothetical protein COOONC_01895, partial [Cooperia oncophora]
MYGCPNVAPGPITSPCAFFFNYTIFRMNCIVLIALVGLSQQYKMERAGYSGVNNAEQVQQTAARSPRNNPVDYTAVGPNVPPKMAGPASYQARPPPAQVAPAVTRTGPAPARTGPAPGPAGNSGGNTSPTTYKNMRPFTFPRGTYLPSESEKGSVLASAAGTSGVDQSGVNIAAILIPNTNPSSNGAIQGHMRGRPVDKATLSRLTNGQSTGDNDGEDQLGAIFIVDFNEFMQDASSQRRGFSPDGANQAAASDSAPQLSGSYSAILIPNLGGNGRRRHRK